MIWQVVIIVLVCGFLLLIFTSKKNEFKVVDTNTKICKIIQQLNVFPKDITSIVMDYVGRYYYDIHSKPKLIVPNDDNNVLVNISRNDDCNILTIQNTFFTIHSTAMKVWMLNSQKNCLVSKTYDLPEGCVRCIFTYLDKCTLIINTCIYQFVNDKFILLKRLPRDGKHGKIYKHFIMLLCSKYFLLLNLKTKKEINILKITDSNAKFWFCIYCDKVFITQDKNFYIFNLLSKKLIVKSISIYFQYLKFEKSIYFWNYFEIYKFEKNELVLFLDLTGQKQSTFFRIGKRLCFFRRSTLFEVNFKTKQFQQFQRLFQSSANIWKPTFRCFQNLILSRNNQSNWIMYNLDSKQEYLIQHSNIYSNCTRLFQTNQILFYNDYQFAILQ